MVTDKFQVAVMGAHGIDTGMTEDWLPSSQTAGTIQVTIDKALQMVCQKLGLISMTDAVHKAMSEKVDEAQNSLQSKMHMHLNAAASDQQVYSP